MATADEWRHVCAQIAEAPFPERSPLVPALYTLARAAGIAQLRRRWEYTEEAAMDVVHDVLATRFREIVEAESPQALFLRILVHRAIDLHRRRDREKQASEARLEAVADPASASAPASLQLEQVLTLLANELSPRDLRVFGARCVGATSKEVADAEGLSVANVDQIVSRARARLKELLDADPE